MKQKRIYTVILTVKVEELSDTITVVISVIDVNDTVISATFLQLDYRKSNNCSSL